MKTRIIAAALAASALLPLAAAHAQHEGGIARGQQQVRDRIAQGVHSGALTEGEAHRLYQRERALSWQLASMERDGGLSHDERRRVRAQMEALHAEIDHRLNNHRHAHVPMPGLQRRQEMVRQRIEDGVASGSITPREAERLEQREHDVLRLQARAQRDGVVTQEERAMLRDQVALLNDEVDRMISNHRRVYYRR
ncbi:hypothetical protein [Noviherbaspirillum aridicola]|uniref:hypothetical protein n=1 Tax=Noviherbaspirillum aridicola TaxID=2849687 RepID=UPI001C7E70DE|nr:hypothetical protein [Noviherbaspirillum aridicola]